MRCQFCGWDNPSNKENCEKCGKSLQLISAVSSSATDVANERPTTRQRTQNITNLKATVRESSVKNETPSNKDGKNVCPSCGYKLELGVCPSCGYNANIKEEESSNQTGVMDECKKTIRPHRKADNRVGFLLTPISEETGLPEDLSIKFEGNEIVLNRENTDPKNSTITSQLQALVCNKEGKWEIIDHSELRTTFVQAKRGMELKSGDLILLGNQLYQFDCQSELK